MDGTYRWLDDDGVVAGQVRSVKGEGTLGGGCVGRSGSACTDNDRGDLKN